MRQAGLATTERGKLGSVIPWEKFTLKTCSVVELSEGHKEIEGEGTGSAGRPGGSHEGDNSIEGAPEGLQPKRRKISDIKSNLSTCPVCIISIILSFPFRMLLILVLQVLLLSPFPLV